MPSAPDYSQYIAVKKINVAQTANSNTTVVKTAKRSGFNGYFPLYKGIRLPPNALLSNKFTNVSGTSGPPPFGPSDLVGLSLWLDAADATTLTLSGSDVSTWVDKSSVANSYTQSTSGNMPSYSLDSTYGAYGVFFDGVNDNLVPVNNSLRSLNSSNWTIFYVSRLTGTTDNYMSIYRSSPSGFWNRFRVDIPQWSFYVVGSEVAVNQSLVNARGIFSDVVSSTAHTVYQNGSQLGSPSTGVSTSYSETFTIGGNGTNESMTGYMFEFIIYNGTGLTTLNRQKVEGYLAWKWNLTDNLPSNHPYKSAAP